ncbi:MAG: hypothetical protein HYT28_01475 [Parcubacteria group bacterium]|nr:hypothetical protein [Parcubacteria group bacterium]
MRHKNIFLFTRYAIFFIAVIVGIGAVGVSSAQALTAQDIVFPVSELGDCKDEKACRAYCDDLSHVNACLSFAEKYNLIPPDELREAKKFAQLGETSGPGGCASKGACDTYCEDVAHIEECVAFGEKHGLIPPDELKEAKQVAKALKDGAVPPGGCKGKKECQAYCEDGAHIDECLAFAEKAGFIPPEELAEARRIAPLMKSGQMPGGCKGKKECEAYCNDDSHFEECLAFGEKAGFVSAKDAEMARKTGGKGPGGCKREECQTYCEDPAHQDACFAFAQEHGLIPPDELENINRHVGEFRKMLDEAPAPVSQCLKDALGSDVIEGIRAGTKMPGKNIGDTAQKCFEQFGGMGGPENGEGGFMGNMPPEVESCVTERIGKEGLQNMGKMSQEERQKAESEIRGCFEQFSGEQPRGDFRDMQGNMLEDFNGGFEHGENGMMKGKDDERNIREREIKKGFQEHFNLNAVPESARDCVKGALDSSRAPSDIGGTIERCVREGMPSLEHFKNPEEFQRDVQQRIFEGEQKFDDRQSFERPMMGDDNMMRIEGEKFIPQMPQTEQGFQEGERTSIMPIIQPIDSGMMLQQEQQQIAPPPPQTEPTGFTAPLDGSIAPPPPSEAPQSNAKSASLLGNIFMIANQLIAH